MRKTPEPMGQLARWITLLEQYDFAIEHRSGSRHGNADGLSRKRADSDDEAECRVTSTTFGESSFAKTQAVDVSCANGASICVCEFANAATDTEDTDITLAKVRIDDNVSEQQLAKSDICLLYTSPSPRD